MGVTTTTDRVRTVLRMVHTEVSDRKDSDFTGLAGYAYSIAIRRVVDGVMAYLDTGDLPDVAPVDVMNAARTHCHEVCPYGQEAEPGKHITCAICPLRQYTVDLLLGTAEAVAREAQETRRKDEGDE